MRFPAIQGIIDRRVLVNFTADPEVVQNLLPKPFSPKLYKGKAIVGVCLIRLKQIRPKGFPGRLGISSENGAHRIAVTWVENGKIKEGVYIPRRDTSSRLNALAGGRVFPGRHFHAAFSVKEKDDTYCISFKSIDEASVSIDAIKTSIFPTHSIFQNLQEVSQFFEADSIGFSPTSKGFEGLELKTPHWRVEPLRVTKVQSSFFEDEHIFPKGSVQFDHALLMTGIQHEWHSVSNMPCCL